MVYALGGGNTDYDPSLQGLPSNNFIGLDGESGFSTVEVADTTPDDGGRIGRRSRHVGRAVLPDNVPTKLLRTGPSVSRAKLLDINRQTGSIDLVNQTFKDIVEGFEPGIHQFFPITYYDSKGKDVIGEGYFMVICQRISTLHPTLCIPALDDRGRYSTSHPDFQDDPVYMNRDKSLDQIVFSTEKIGGHHMWHDKKYPTPCWFSNELTEALIGAKLTGLVHFKYEQA